MCIFFVFYVFHIGGLDMEKSFIFNLFFSFAVQLQAPQNEMPENTSPTNFPILLSMWFYSKGTHVNIKPPLYLKCYKTSYDFSFSQMFFFH